MLRTSRASTTSGPDSIVPGAPAIEVTDLTVTYGHVVALRDVTLQLPAGKLVGVVGPNGSGKSTLLKCVVGAHRQARGTIQVLGGDRRAARRLVAYVPQRSEVERDFPITVREVVQLGRHGERGWFRRLTALDHELVDEALERTGITHLARRPVDALSGGQLQRTFFARALAQDRPVLALDEPFVGIDAKTEAELFDLLEQLRDSGRSIIVVHHDLADVRDRFDHCALLDGRLLDQGDPKRVLDPERVFDIFSGHREGSGSSGVASPGIA
ncbi:MAG: metal ABC transporter ATP-binding protein [Gaiellales bacterium]